MSYVLVNFLRLSLILICNSVSLGEVLTRALNGASQNPNEAFHSVLWTFAPKNRYTSGTIMDICVSLAVIIFNEGYSALGSFFRQIFGEQNVFFLLYFFKSLFDRLDWLLHLSWSRETRSRSYSHGAQKSATKREAARTRYQASSSWRRRNRWLSSRRVLTEQYISTSTNFIH